MRLNLVKPHTAVCENETHLYRELDLPPQTWVRRYDAMSRIIEETLFQSDGELLFRWIYLYDESSRRVEGNLHGADGMLLARCFYDGRGNVIDRRTYNYSTHALAA